MKCDWDGCEEESDWALEVDAPLGGRWNYCTDHLLEHVGND